MARPCVVRILYWVKLQNPKLTKTDQWDHNYSVFWNCKCLPRTNRVKRQKACFAWRLSQVVFM